MESDTRTEQEKQSHPHLVAVRNAVESHCEVSRSEAASIVNHMSHSDCDHVLAAGDDGDKVRSVAEGAWESSQPETADDPAEKPEPKKPKRRTAKTAD